MREIIDETKGLMGTVIGYAALGLIGALSMGAEVVSQARRPREYASGQST